MIELNDETYFALIYASYSKLIFRISWKLTKNIDDSNDIVSDAFAHIYLNRAKIENEQHLKIYLIRCAKQLAINSILKHQRYCRVEPDLFAQNDSFALGYDFCRINDLLAANLERLDYQILISHSAYAWTFKEIAQFLNLPPHKVATRHRKTLQKARLILIQNNIVYPI